MGDLKLHTSNLVDINLEKILSIFPHCSTEIKTPDGFLKKAIDFDLLKQELSHSVVTGDQERYHLNWIGKKEAILQANSPILKTLRPSREESVNFDQTKNLFIEGDNLEALKLLQENYLGKIKIVYIDPPYNTGNDFIYKDNYAVDSEEFLFKSNQLDDLGNKLVNNLESNGRFHSDWLSMMFSRIKLARNLLSDDGLIVMSIGEDEVANLTKIANEVFGENNFINQIVVKTKVAGVSGSYFGGSLQNNTEFALLYCKNKMFFNIDNIPQKKQELYSFIENMEANGKSWKYTSVIKSMDEGEYVKSIEAGNGDEIKIFKHTKYEFASINQIAKEEFNGDRKKAYYKYIDTIFRTTNAQSSTRTRVMNETTDIDSDLISIEYVPSKGKNAGKAIRLYYKDKQCNLVTLLKEVVAQEDGVLYKLDNKGNLWDDINYNNLSNEAGITYPNGQKPIQLVKDLLKMFRSDDAIILDFFAGSSTTAHAVMKLNAEDGGHRQFIMVQIPESIDVKEDAYKSGFRKITDLSKERIRIAGKKIAEEFGSDHGVDTGFRVLKVDSSNMKDVYYRPDEIGQGDLDGLASHIKEDRTHEDLLFQVILDLGLEYTLPFENQQIDGKLVTVVDQNRLVVCFDKLTDDVVNAIAELHPKDFVSSETCVDTDHDKTNIKERFKQLSPETKVSFI